MEIFIIFFSIFKNEAYRKDVSVRIWKLTFFFFLKEIIECVVYYSTSPGGNHL